jgi:hypothetical protein
MVTPSVAVSLLGEDIFMLQIMFFIKNILQNILQKYCTVYKLYKSKKS